jgi:hypothetical protein
VTETQKATEIEQLDAEIQELETEAAAPPDLSWDEIVELSAEDLTQREQRKGVLDKMIQARKARKLELEAQLLREEAEAARDETEKTYEAFQTQDEKLQRQKEKRDASWSTWQIQQGVLINIEQRLRRIETHLTKIEEGEVT